MQIKSSVILHNISFFKSAAIYQPTARQSFAMHNSQCTMIVPPAAESCREADKLAIYNYTRAKKLSQILSHHTKPSDPHRKLLDARCERQEARGAL